MPITYESLPDHAGCVLADGVFDPIHPGHVAYLAAARRLGRVLVTVASDEDIIAKGRVPLLSQAQRVAVIEALDSVDAVYAKDRPMVDILRQLRPAIYAKGPDWEGRLPADQVAVCQELGIEIAYVGQTVASSGRLLADWSLRQTDQGLGALERYIAAQSVTPPERYDREYFAGDWRTTAPPYTLEGRRLAEGRHPDIIADLWRGRTVLDVGCGPGHLVTLLRERGMDAGGIDPSANAVALAGEDRRVVWGHVADLPSGIADVVICREVLEHLTVREVAAMVPHLFRVARHAVYLTTRFHPSPASLVDVTDERDIDPTHQTLLTQPLLRTLCVLQGGRRRRDWEAALDWQGKGRVLVYEL